MRFAAAVFAVFGVAFGAWCIVVLIDHGPQFGVAGMALLSVALCHQATMLYRGRRYARRTGIVGAAAIMLTVLYLTHGFRLTTTVAVVGTLASLTVTAGLSAFVTATAHLTGVRIEAHTGLVVDAARAVGADFIVKGLRTAGDFEFELQMALTNESVSGVRTVFLPTAAQYGFVSSRFIREIAQYRGDVRHLVPEPVARRLADLAPPERS